MRRLTLCAAQKVQAASSAPKSSFMPIRRQGPDLVRQVTPARLPRRQAIENDGE
jgi:hypothetical protein